MSKNIGTLANSALAYSQRAQASRLVSTWSQATAEDYQMITNRLLAQVTELAAKEKTENANPNHSPVGRFDKVKIAVQDFIVGLQWLRDAKAGIETRAANIYRDLFILPVSKLNEVVQGQRDAFIWSAIGSLPTNERDNQYLAASEADNVEVLRALQDSPLPLTSGEVRLRADDERAARLFSKRYRNLVELGELLSEVTVILQDCLDLGLAFSLDVPANNDELGPKTRMVLDFAIQHQGGRGKHALKTSAKDVVRVGA